MAYTDNLKSCQYIVSFILNSWLVPLLYYEDGDIFLSYSNGALC